MTLGMPSYAHKNGEKRKPKQSAAASAASSQAEEDLSDWWAVPAFVAHCASPWLVQGAMSYLGVEPAVPTAIALGWSLIEYPMKWGGAVKRLVCCSGSRNKPAKPGREVLPECNPIHHNSDSDLEGLAQEIREAPNSQHLQFIGLDRHNPDADFLLDTAYAGIKSFLQTKVAQNRIRKGELNIVLAKIIYLFSLTEAYGCDPQFIVEELSKRYDRQIKKEQKQAKEEQRAKKTAMAAAQKEEQEKQIQRFEQDRIEARQLDALREREELVRRAIAHTRIEDLKEELVERAIRDPDFLGSEENLDNGHALALHEAIQELEENQRLEQMSAKALIREVHAIIAGLQEAIASEDANAIIKMLRNLKNVRQLYNNKSNGQFGSHFNSPKDGHPVSELEKAARIAVQRIRMNADVQ